jgi:mandelamide amidase
VVLPTTPVPAPPLADSETMLHGGRRVPTFETLIRNTDASSNAGLPCISLPAGRTPDGLPVGLELVGTAGADRTLLAMARAVQDML